MSGAGKPAAGRIGGADTGALAAGMAAAALCLLLLVGCGPPTARAPEATPTPAARTTELAVALDGAELAVRWAAPIDPALTLIALHGGPGVSSHYMRDLERFAAHGYHLVTYDQRGVGASELPSPDFTMEAYVQDLAAVQGELTETGVVLFGHSWGGLLALNYAARHPGRVHGLVLFGSAPPTRTALTEASGRFEARLQALQSQGLVPEPLPGGDGYLRALQPVYFSDPTTSLPPALQNLEHSRQINSRTWGALGNYDFRRRLEPLDLPVLFFYGLDDPFGRAMGQATLDALPNAQLTTVWLEDCGHYWFECPEPFERELLQFLGELSAGIVGPGPEVD